MGRLEGTLWRSADRVGAAADAGTGTSALGWRHQPAGRCDASWRIANSARLIGVRGASNQPGR
jgi:hypothetical protein